MNVFEAMSHSFKTGDRIKILEWHDDLYIYWSSDDACWIDNEQSELSLRFLQVIICNPFCNWIVA